MSKSTTPLFDFDNTFATTLEGFYEPCQPVGFAEPRLIQLNMPLAVELGLHPDELTSEKAAALISGNALPEGATPLAQAYAGHQFGGFSPQLGDGRALLLGEVMDVHNRRRDIQLKGSGPTPFSRGGDGRAALGPILREYLVGEAMHALGVPTTRALGAVTTGELVQRERMLPGAVLARVGASHLRVGTFEYFAARGDQAKLRKLADYTLARHYPNRLGANNPYLELLLAVSDAQAKLVAQWMLVGFIHGVMNTDNMTVSGETIDYGPCAFMDAYDPKTVFSSIDTHGRYAYGNQPRIARWNLARFAEALLPLLAEEAGGSEPSGGAKASRGSEASRRSDLAVSHGEAALEAFPAMYERAWLQGMRRKLGLAGAGALEGGHDHPQGEDHDAGEEDRALAEELLSLMRAARADYTSVFRNLSNAARGHATPVAALFGSPTDLEIWLTRWRARLDRDPIPNAAIADQMDRVNPLYIPRNHSTEDALTAAVERQDFSIFESLLDAVSNPYEARPEWARYAAPAPADFGPYRTFCGT
ncbi:MAG: YdiU family protein [Nannocystaceae bacterium]